MTIWFVTGTDTGVGKTVATAALVAVLRADGRSPYVVKPAQTGVEPDEIGDLDDIRRLTGGVPGHEGARLRLPLAPDTAARLEGVDLPALAAQHEALLDAAAHHDVLVEGAGGILVRVGADWNLLDLAQSVAHRGIEVAFVVVARSGLGTLNHAALTVAAIQSRDLPVAGVLIGSWPDDPDLASEQNLLDLPTLTGVPVLGRIPEGAGRYDDQSFTAAAPTWLQLPAG
ncbi:ATP-dependent dethiobiotin synthetase BioD [Nocardioides marmoriginsengisoli]|uniref:ATP-dependent dethiobiotin synthetase BioD n=1 Tax=Nocardioides marmoriginsengisoli TaxID=661483 RepID=A0A3N0CQS0_9ACTN|nr:dethiobiotin synthase [Nocardioides marmoriginsengisoli]RNL65822.1 ATP-dependent dethiobiotin synthetase BioD [Nocardioides marmoriginsengisoli]